jgi:hypothetical protein
MEEGGRTGGGSGWQKQRDGEQMNVVEASSRTLNDVMATEVVEGGGLAMAG